MIYIGSVGAGKLYPGARIKAAFSNNFIQRLVEWKPDIIHSQCEFFTFLAACRIAKSLSVPIVHTYHTVYEDYTHYFLSNKRWGKQMTASLSRWVAGQCSCVIAPTEKVRTILNGYGIEQHVHVIPTGISLRRFAADPAPERQLAVKSWLKIPERNRILLYAGRLAKEKNLEELLRYHARQNTETLTFLIAGDGPHRGALEQMASDLGIRDSVRFAGMVPPEQIGDYYHTADLFVSGSTSETQGLTCLEALSSGLPALCRRDACLDGVVLNGYNGWQYEKEQDYRENINIFFSDVSLQKSMRENASRFAQKMFSSSVFGIKIERTYLDVLGKLPAGKACRHCHVQLRAEYDLSARCITDTLRKEMLCVLPYIPDACRWYAKAVSGRPSRIRRPSWRASALKLFINGRKIHRSYISIYRRDSL